MWSNLKWTEIPIGKHEDSFPCQHLLWVQFCVQVLQPFHASLEHASSASSSLLSLASSSSIIINVVITSQLTAFFHPSLCIKKQNVHSNQVTSLKLIFCLTTFCQCPFYSVASFSPSLASWSRRKEKSCSSKILWLFSIIIYNIIWWQW